MLRSIRAAIIMFAAAAGFARGQEFSLESAGARAGASPTNNGHDFHQVEGFINMNLPWRWDVGRGWNLQTRLDGSGGWLGTSSAETAVFTLGPCLLLREEHFPLSFETGSSPTWLSNYHVGSKNFGEPFQFTSHIGFNLDWGAHFRIGYRLQHMSNGGISGHNSGLNLHMLKVSYLF